MICFYGGGAKVTEHNGIIQHVTFFISFSVKFHLFREMGVKKRVVW